jgi:hypothetical protein
VPIKTAELFSLIMRRGKKIGSASHAPASAAPPHDPAGTPDSFSRCIPGTNQKGDVKYPTTPLGHSRSAIEKAEPRWERDHLVDGEPAATQELLVLLQLPLPCVAEVDKHSQIHRNRRIERNRGRDLFR